MINLRTHFIAFFYTILFVLFCNPCHGAIKKTTVAQKNNAQIKNKKSPTLKKGQLNKYRKRVKPFDKKVSPKKTKTKTLFLAHLAHNDSESSNSRITHNNIKSKKQPQKNIGTNDEYENTPTDQPHYIRVLLKEHAPGETVNITLKAKDGFVLESPAHSNITALYQEEELSLLIKDGKYFLKCQDGKLRRVKHNDIEICSPHNKINLNGKDYQGSFYICKDKNSSATLIINKLELEDYLYSVLRHEGIPSWPPGMHKVQAVASRTYALYHMKQTRIKNPKSPYDLKNTSYFQIYNGSHPETHLRRAVEETRNMVLTYKGNIALTMFDICCGGIIPAHLKSCDETKPYLCRKDPCPYCKNTAYYSWKETFNKTAVLDCLKNCGKCKDKFAHFGSSITDMHVIETDRAGVAHKIKCVGKRTKTVILTASEVKSALQGRLKSLAFSIKKDGNQIVFHGHGNSHFKGLCQWGAKGLVDRGWNYKEILQFYYPGTKLSYLK